MTATTMQPIPALLGYCGNGNPLIVEEHGGPRSCWVPLAVRIPATYEYLHLIAASGVTMIAVEVEPGRHADFSISELTQVGLRAAGEQIQAERRA
jgi:hypothetical protein